MTTETFTPGQVVLLIATGEVFDIEQNGHPKKAKVLAVNGDMVHVRRFRPGTGPSLCWVRASSLSAE